MAINSDSTPRFPPHRGDSGDTSLLTGERARKDSPNIEAAGTLDELNALLGLVRTENLSPEDQATLLAVQTKLFDVSACVVDPMPPVPCCETSSKTALLLSDADLLFLDTEIARRRKRLKPLHHFLLPGENRPSALLHVARTVARRAERRAVALHNINESVRPILLAWLNRLSELLFTMARCLAPEESAAGDKTQKSDVSSGESPHV